ncbi:glycosyltransferase family 2 protein [Chitinibacter sp. SCUT-21]|uniref:glycosyltransferase family 2 protein n=1 Tax=Chitinibacter sp. SCUT-21 TaxID=2970891 RepID=UPI0035A5820E
MHQSPLISVVVIGHNEGQRLTRCLASVRECHYPAIELIYVDSHSSDDSATRASYLADQVYFAQQKGAAAARNVGLSHAKGEWIMFLDGDTRLAPQFLNQAMAELQQNSQLACVWGHRFERYPRQSIYVQVLDLDWRYQPGETAFCGGDALFRRSALTSVNGFNARLIAGEEPELCCRLRQQGWRILHIDAAMTQHDLAITRFTQYWQRTCRAGYAYAAVSALKHQFWANEVAHNVKQSSVLSLLGVLMFLGALLQPLLSALALSTLMLLMLRSSWRARWRSAHWPTLLLYGAHSWFAVIPIRCGIWQFRRDQQAQRSASFRNYKEAEK